MLTVSMRETHQVATYMLCGCVDLPESMVQVQPRILAHIIDKDTLQLVDCPTQLTLYDLDLSVE